MGGAGLVQQSTLGTDFTVVTIFVNPTQFAPTEDLDQYPRTATGCGAIEWLWR